MKGGSQMMIVVALATWICCCWSIAFGWTSVLLQKTNYNTSSFDTTFQDASVGFYQMFMQSLRRELSSGSESYDIRLLRPKSQVTEANQFVYVRLFNKQFSITFAVYALNAYVVAHQVDAQNPEDIRCYFYKEVPPNTKTSLFPSCTKKRVDVDLSTNYAKLGDREKIRLGFKPLDQSLQVFNGFDSKNPTTELKHNLLIVIQMVAEAARFKYIQTKLEWKGFESGFFPGGDVISFENNWDALSRAIQGSKDGNFAPIQLINEDNTARTVSTVAQVKDDMGLLLNAAK